MINDYFRIGFICFIIAAIVLWFNGKHLVSVATTPLFVYQMREHIDASGGFSWLRMAAWLFVFWVPVMLFGNYMTQLIYTPPELPKKMRATLSTITKVPEELIAVRQFSPEWLVIYNNPKFLVGVRFCRENEEQLEGGCRIDISDFYIYVSGEIWVRFTKARTRRMAKIWVVQRDGSMVQDSGAHGFGYVFGDAYDFRFCKEIKVGFAETLDNVGERFKEHQRHVSGAHQLRIFPLRSRREETAIHKQLEATGARLNDSSEPGRELFDATNREVIAWYNSLDEIYQDV